MENYILKYNLYGYLFNIIIVLWLKKDKIYWVYIKYYINLSLSYLLYVFNCIFRVCVKILLVDNVL